MSQTNRNQLLWPSNFHQVNLRLTSIRLTLHTPIFSSHKHRRFKFRHNKWPNNLFGHQKIPSQQTFGQLLLQVKEILRSMVARSPRLDQIQQEWFL